MDCGDESSAAVEWLEEHYDRLFQITIEPFCGCGADYCEDCSEGRFEYLMLNEYLLEVLVDDQRVEPGPDCRRRMFEVIRDQESSCYGAAWGDECWCYAFPSYPLSLGPPTDKQLDNWVYDRGGSRLEGDYFFHDRHHQWWIAMTKRTRAAVDKNDNRRVNSARANLNL